MSSDYKVPLTTILALEPLVNSDRLSLATVYGWQVVVQRDKFQVGSRIVYVPIDSILSEKIESLLFGPDSKIKLHKSRIRQIKIRGMISSGMAIDPSELSSIINFDKIALETDLSEILNIKKYEPPTREAYGPSSTGKTGRKRLDNIHFHSYNGLQNIKWNPTMFKEGDPVVIQCKLHGTNSRLGILPFSANTIWKKVKLFLGLAPEFERCYGSNRVNISSSNTYKGFYGEDIYGAVFNKINAFSKVKPNETIFGEIIGPGIQKGYSYGLKEHAFVLFDVKVLQPDGSQTWLTPDEVEVFAKERGFEMVPILYKGPYNYELAKALTLGPSEYGDKSEKVREGCVIKAAKNYSIEGNKMALKFVSEVYLADFSNTDEH